MLLFEHKNICKVAMLKVQCKGRYFYRIADWPPFKVIILDERGSDDKTLRMSAMSICAF